MPPQPSSGTAGERGTIFAFSATILLSALLLFSVQPMVAKMVLPILGGAPATWAVSLCFFQALLLLGYAYAHVLGTWVPIRRALGLHVALLLAAFLTLPIVAPVATRPPEGSLYLWLLATLAAMTGLPFFALSASAPLLQSWFGRSGHSRSADPYFLYAASNAGSLIALLAYPVLVEPLLPLTSQSRVWQAGFLVLAAAVAACGRIVLRQEGGSPALPPDGSAPMSFADSWRRRGAWIFLSFVPSGLLVAYTTYVTTDLASAPLLWVLPLAIYLATFIAVFRRRPPVDPRILFALQPLLLAGTIVAGDWKGSYSWIVSTFAGLLAFTVTSLVCHGELYRQRPEARHLTGYYLCISLGGVLGGIFSALLAPLLFTDILEFPLLLGLGMLAVPGLWRAAQTARGLAGFALLIAAAVGGVLLFRFLLTAEVLKAHGDLRLLVLCGLGIALAAAVRLPRVAVALTAALILASVAIPSASTSVFTVRSFFGTHRVVDTAGGGYRLLLHGTTVHGIQQNRSGTAALSRPTPLAYYHPSGPLAQALQLARGEGERRHLRTGIVGLGTGAMACYAAQGDRWRFYEIDPAVVDIATTPSLFRYIARCLPAPEIVVGDARLTLAEEEDGTFDYLLIDAFSSDAIPIHLLTVEALSLYLRKLAEGGILALHVSNQNLDLPPVIEANLAQIPGVTGIYVEGQRGSGALASQAVLIARDGDRLLPALTWHRARRLGHPHVRPWTDDYSDFISAVWRRYKSKWEGTAIRQ